MSDSQWIIDKVNSLSSEPESEGGAVQDKPVSIGEFVTSPDYIGLDYFWKRPLQELDELRREGCLGGVIEKGIGGGKSFGISILPLYDIYCLGFEEIILGKDPRDRFNLARAMVIYAAVFTVTSKLAREIFRYMQGFAANCPWFKKHLPINPDLTSELHFLHPETGEVRYIAYPGHSKVSSSIGRNIYSFILDEPNFFQITDGSASSTKDYAEELYEQLEDRVRSRFGLDGSTLVISSRNTVHDFTARLRTKLEMSDNAHRYYLPPPKSTWADWPDKKNTSNKWRLFNVSTLRWDGDPVEYGDTLDIDGFWVPKVFWNSFSTDPEKALKNLGSIPSEAIEPFFRRRGAIVPDFEMLNPILPTTKPEDWLEPVPENELAEYFDSLVHDSFYGDPEEKYHFHVDLALNGDGCGFAFGRSSGIDSSAQSFGGGKEERAALIDIEFMALIKPRKGQEVEFARVREIIYWLRDYRAFRFRKSSYDGWQSIDSMQILKRKGIAAELLSMDRTLEPYTTMKDALYEGRMWFYPAHGQTPSTSYQEICRMADAGDPSAVFQRELVQMEIVKGKKVDHPKNGSKDVADAVCGSVTQITRFMRGSH